MIVTCKILHRLSGDSDKPCRSSPLLLEGLQIISSGLLFARLHHSLCSLLRLKAVHTSPFVRYRIVLMNNQPENFGRAICMPLYTNAVIPAGKRVDCWDAGGMAMQEQLPNPGPGMVSLKRPCSLDSGNPLVPQRVCRNDGLVYKGMGYMGKLVSTTRSNTVFVPCTRIRAVVFIQGSKLCKPR